MNTLTSVVQNFVTSLLALPLSQLTQGNALLGIEVDPKDPIARWASKAPPPARPAKAASGRLARRSPEDVEKDIGRVLDLLKRHPDIHRAEEISSSLSLSPREMPRILGDAVAAKRLVRRGKARGTQYFLPGKGEAPQAAKKSSPKKTAKKAAPKKVAKKAAPKKTVKRAPKKSATVKDSTVPAST